MRLPLKELKKDIISIDKIEETDGIGKINSRFLKLYPDFVHFNVLRTAKNVILIKDILSSNQGDNNFDKNILLVAKHMKFGAGYFIIEAFKLSYSGRALKALFDAKKITKAQYEQLLTLLIFSIYEGVKYLGAIEYFDRAHIIPYKKNFNGTLYLFGTYL